MQKPISSVIVNINNCQVFNMYRELLEKTSYSKKVTMYPFSYNLAREKALRIFIGVMKRKYGSDIEIVPGPVTFQRCPEEGQMSLFPSP